MLRAAIREEPRAVLKRLPARRPRGRRLYRNRGRRQRARDARKRLRKKGRLQPAEEARQPARTSAAARRKPRRPTRPGAAATPQKRRLEQTRPSLQSLRLPAHRPRLNPPPPSPPPPAPRLRKKVATTTRRPWRAAAAKKPGQGRRGVLVLRGAGVAGQPQRREARRRARARRRPPKQAVEPQATGSAAPAMSPSRPGLSA
mmetsp:Transcript_97011/g.274092  ORF Transcript_97011/g.274092 Transcript_97011/m.274092 type:complete len:201 (+) Transcript_97011:419-1021(+)